MNNLQEIINYIKKKMKLAKKVSMICYLKVCNIVMIIKFIYWINKRNQSYIKTQICKANKMIQEVIFKFYMIKH